MIAMTEQPKSERVLNQLITIFYRENTKLDEVLLVAMQKFKRQRINQTLYHDLLKQSFFERH